MSAFLVNRKPISEETLEALKAECYPLSSFSSDTISEEDLTAKGVEVLSTILVEGEPAHGIMLRRYLNSRAWFGFREVE